MTENLKVPFLILSVFAGCCSNVVFLELLVKEDPGSGNLITFSQFLSVASIGFIFTSKCGTKKRLINLNAYVLLVIMFFLANVFNNYAFNLNIAMPLHMIFRSGSLIANMIMGIIILRKSYTLDKYFSVGTITAGIIICTINSGSNVKNIVGKNLDAVKTTESEDFFWWTVGIGCLTLALLVSARMGIYQEVMYEKYGKHPAEALYYTHLLPLPGFLILCSNLWDHFMIALNSTPITISTIGVSLPCIIAYLIGNMLTQYLCISSVYRLCAECSSLTVTLVVTLRKFVSLVFSIFYFNNPFTMYHWMGTFLVFAGTVMYMEIPQKIFVMEKQMHIVTKKDCA